MMSCSLLRPFTLLVPMVLAVSCGGGSSGSGSHGALPEPGAVASMGATHEPTILVKAGEKIQDAVDRAVEGDVIGIEPGIYHETVLVETSNITLVGMVQDGRRPVLDGTRIERGEAGKIELRPDAVQARSCDNIVVEGLRMVHYQGNGVVVNDCNGVVLRDLVADKVGLYGLYPIGCRNILIEGCVVSRCSDAGIYVGQSDGAVVRNNECFANVAGLEIENSSHAVVVNNSCHHNTAGILVFVLPNLQVKKGEDTVVRGNRVWANNLPNWGAKGSVVGQVPHGSGVIIIAADRTHVIGNEIWDNDSFGIATMSLGDMNLPGELDVEPHSDGSRIEDNLYAGNGTRPHERLGVQKIPVGLDLIWNGQGQGNCWLEPSAKSFPPELPRCK